MYIHMFMYICIYLLYTYIHIHVYICMYLHIDKMDEFFVLVRRDQQTHRHTYLCVVVVVCLYIYICIYILNSASSYQFYSNDKGESP